jgi:hypothetical protein
MTTSLLVRVVTGLRMLEVIDTLLHRLHGVVFNTTRGQLCLTLKQTLISQYLLRVIIVLSLMSLLPWKDLIRTFQYEATCKTPLRRIQKAVTLLFVCLPPCEVKICWSNIDQILKPYSIRPKLLF